MAGVLADWSRPMTAEEVLVALVKAAPAFGFADRPANEWALMFEPHLRILVDVPPEALAFGLDEWHRTGRGYWPKPGDLYPLVARHAGVLRVAAYRAKKASERAEYRVEHRKRVTAEDRAEMIAKGWLTPDGKPIIGPAKERPPLDPSTTRETPAELAARLRAATPPEEHEEEPI